MKMNKMLLAAALLLVGGQIVAFDHQIWNSTPYFYKVDMIFKDGKLMSLKVPAKGSANYKTSGNTNSDRVSRIYVTGYESSDVDPTTNEVKTGATAIFNKQFGGAGNASIFTLVEKEKVPFCGYLKDISATLK